MSVFKAQAHARELKQRLSLLIAGAVITSSLDSSGQPETKIVSGAETIFVKISLQGNAGRVDALGMPQTVYSPHQCQILQDGDTVSDKNARAIVLSACTKLAMKMELWEINTLPSSFDLTGATLISSIPADEINGLQQSQ
jgi:hypothetical protein